MVNVEKEGQSVPSPSLPISLYGHLQIPLGYCLICLGHRLGDTSLYDKFVLSGKCDPSP